MSLVNGSAPQNWAMLFLTMSSGTIMRCKISALDAKCTASYSPFVPFEEAVFVPAGVTTAVAPAPGPPTSKAQEGSCCGRTTPGRLGDQRSWRSAIGRGAGRGPLVSAPQRPCQPWRWHDSENPRIVGLSARRGPQSADVPVGRPLLRHSTLFGCRFISSARLRRGSAPPLRMRPRDLGANE